MSGRCNFYYEIIGYHREVTGSHIVVKAIFPNGRKVMFLVDMGLYEESKYEYLNSEIDFNIEEIDFALLTHLHADHIGRFPLIVKNGYMKAIYTSKPTKMLSRTALNDSCKILGYIQHKKGEKNLYSEKDVEQTLEQMIGLEYNETIEVVEGVKVTLLVNGHCLGASMILVQLSYPGEKDINILFSGDYKKDNLFFYVPKIPQWIIDLPKDVICESTYGDTDTTEIKEVYEENIIKCLKSGGTAVLLSFAFQRYQEILYKIKKMQDNKVISKDIPIYLLGKLGITYTTIFSNSDMNLKPEMREFVPKHARILIRKEDINEIFEDDGQKIILTTSGMGNFGPAQEIIPYYLSDSKALIHFPGYVAENTVGRLLKETKKGENVATANYSTIKLANVEYTNEMSGHSKADELIEYLKMVGNINTVYINHGETEVIKKFHQRVIKEVKHKNCEILEPDMKYRSSCYGLEKAVHLSKK